MENIIAIKVELKENKYIFFLTWGRVFHPINDVLLLESVQRSLFKFGVKNFKSIGICESLQEAVSERYFYEYFFLMCQGKINFGKGYDKWRKSKRKKLEKGEEIYLVSTISKE